MRKLKNEELGRLQVDAFKEAPKTPVVLILDNVRSLHNVGSVFRSADAFRIEKIYLCGITATPPHKDIRKTALGATESVAWEYAPQTESLVRSLRESHECWAVEQASGSVSLEAFQPLAGKPFAFVLGHEVKGVSQEVIDICSGVIEIPQLGTKHSLNISVAAGVVLWDFWSKTRGQTQP
ncbi:RNA methyltransferase [Robiginitalea aurantiaca]|uniref:RNA methyltransferase n=1 Tax=Robiginitalea aurantiaca TaxID=3056915 RepID=A0ABT7WC59_9FLAO|nr:RNA methyltransferase [Robiginitalea aurantiaca]MDM9630494.1 RNA methyltransferase [Robiginitalea aurantiaca]